MEKMIDDETERAVRIFLSMLGRSYSVDQAILFGSRARGSHHPDSDADVALIISGKPDDFVRTKLAMADIAFDAMLETGVIVSPLPIWKSVWERPDRHSNPELLGNIRHEGVVL